MIDIQPYIDKLERLREYMFLCIDGKIPGIIWFNALALPHLPFEKVMEIYNQTGIMFIGNEEEPTLFTKLSFGEWLETQSH